MLGLLGDNYWGEQALAVDSCVRSVSGGSFIGLSGKRWLQPRDQQLYRSTL
jgi:hypothetical protein